jgi:hypothetical protein
VGTAPESANIGQDGGFEHSTREDQAGFIPRDHREVLASTIEILLIECQGSAKVVVP